MADVDPEIIAHLDPAVKEQLEIQVTIDGLTATYKEGEKRRKDAFAEYLAPLHRRVAELDDLIWGELDAHRSELVKPGKQSFITLVAKFQLLHRLVQAKVTDENGALEIARELRIVRKVADPPRTWRLNVRRLMKWLDQHGEYRHLFADCMEDAEVRESLTVQPNANFTVHYNGERVSPPSVSIKKS